MGNTETTRFSDHWIASYSLKENWRHSLCLARPCVPALITTYSTVCHHLDQWSFMFIHLHIQCESTLLPCLSVSLWEQYRVSMWVGLLRGPGWFRSDGRRKLLQEIPNCQTHTLTHTIHNLSFYFSYKQTKAPAQTVRVKKPSRALSLVSAQSDWTSNAKKASKNAAVWCSLIVSGTYICMPNLWCYTTPSLAGNQDFYGIHYSKL